MKTEKRIESLEDYLKANVKGTASIKDAEKALFDYQNKVLINKQNNK